jgi:plasmid stabilization system protein ParE
MELKWAIKAQSDLHRLHDFLSTVNRVAAARTIQDLVSAPRRLLQQPQLGERLDEFAPRDVRRIIVGPYEVRYEVVGTTIFILRLWLGREDR